MCVVCVLSNPLSYTQNDADAECLEENDRILVFAVDDLNEESKAQVDKLLRSIGTFWMQSLKSYSACFASLSQTTLTELQEASNY